MEKVKGKAKQRTHDKVKEPDEYRVILLNDDYTSMEFVVYILVSIFHKGIEDANQIMMSVHRNGRGIVGAYTYDIAITKVAQVHAEAKANEYPLRCVVEPV